MALLDLTLPQTRDTSGGFSLFSFAARAAALHRQRAALRRLDDAALADIGLDRQTAEREASRPFWDVPETWRR